MLIRVSPSIKNSFGKRPTCRSSFGVWMYARRALPLPTPWVPTANGPGRSPRNSPRTTYMSLGQPAQSRRFCAITGMILVETVHSPDQIDSPDQAQLGSFASDESALQAQALRRALCLAALAFPKGSAESFPQFPAGVLRAPLPNQSSTQLSAAPGDPRCLTPPTCSTKRANDPLVTSLHNALISMINLKDIA